MLTTLIAFLAKKLGVSALVIQIVMVCILGGGAYWWLKVHDAKIRDNAWRESELATIEKQRKKFEEEWKIREDQISKEKEEYLLQTIKAQEATIAAEVARQEWEKKYREKKVEIVTKIKEIPKIVEIIPADELIDSIRVKSGELTLPPIPKEEIEKTGKFNEIEERTVLGQLLELEQRRVEVKNCEDAFDEEKINHENEKKACELTVNVEKSKVSTISKERDLAQEKAKFFEDSYNTCKKKPSGLCKFLRFITFGKKQCH